MITTQHIIDNPIDTMSCIGYSPKDCLFFDIETTGFTVNSTHVYLIGCVFFRDNIWNSIQWFAQNHEEEQDVLDTFFHFMRSYKVLIHFNGDGFDIPYLTKKAELFHQTPGFDAFISLDIFKAAASFKKFLKLENYKQKTIETFLGIEREDKYSGRELINIYASYLRTNDEDALQLLLLHNEDDIRGMTALLPMFAYMRIINGEFTLDAVENTKQEIIFHCRLHQAVPKRVSLGYKEFYITAYGNSLKIRIKIYSNELKFFYSNYSDYYYLPKEDVAMHKSVAFYVDKNYRTRAKAANCYSKKTGMFVPQFSEIVPAYFKIDYHDKTMYIELTDEFLNDDALLHRYLLDIIRAI